MFGVVYAPALDELHYGVRGIGAFICDGRQSRADRHPASRRRAAACRRQPFAHGPAHCRGDRAHGRGHAARHGFVAEVLSDGRSPAGRVSALRADLRMGYRGRPVRAGGCRRRGARRWTAGRCAYNTKDRCSTPISSPSATIPCPGGNGWMAEAAASSDGRRCCRIMARLRDPDGGCPWDVQQDFASIAPYTIEEAYEVADAIDRGDMHDLQGRAGRLAAAGGVPCAHGRGGRACSPSTTSSPRSATRWCAGIRTCSPAPSLPESRSRPSPGKKASAMSATPRAAPSITAPWPASPAACRNGSAR